MYKNANQDDLWRTLTEQCREKQVLPGNTTVKDIMDTWTRQTGFPVVTAVRRENGALDLSQQRFFLDKKADETDNVLWYVFFVALIYIIPRYKII